MSDRARAWLSLRAGAVPPALEAYMEAAVDDVLDDDTVHGALADAARGCLREAIARGDARAAALPLLAADALMTYAFEAAAEVDAAALRELSDAWSTERLSVVLRAAGAS